MLGLGYNLEPWTTATGSGERFTTPPHKTEAMSEKIYKYPIPVADLFGLDLPRGAQPLCVGVQDVPCMWVRVDTDPSVPVVRRTFRLVGTGHDLGSAPAFSYIGTFHMPGPLVFHLFEVMT